MVDECRIAAFWGFRTLVPLAAARSIQDFASDEMPAWKTRDPSVESLYVGTMGCIVNGPGEYADIGNSLPAPANPGGARVCPRQEIPHPLARLQYRHPFRGMVVDYIN